LKVLDIGTDREGVSMDNYNHFIGSLEPLGGQVRARSKALEELDIDATDIREGLENLPASLKRI